MKTKYPAGTRILLIHMDDPYPVPDGTKGTVDFVDDAGHIHMKWDDGRTLSLVEGVDEFKIITEERQLMSFFDTTEFAINKYEDEIPDMLLGAHEDYHNGNISAEDYANALRKIYGIIEMLYIGGKK